MENSSSNINLKFKNCDFRRPNSRAGTSGIGSSNSEGEEMQDLLVKYLSLIRTPEVTKIEGRSALLKWGPPVRDQHDQGTNAKFEPLEHISESDFRYEVCLSDKGKDGKYRIIFTTPSIECWLTGMFRSFNF